MIPFIIHIHQVELDGYSTNRYSNTEIIDSVKMTLHGKKVIILKYSEKKVTFLGNFLAFFLRNTLRGVDWGKIEIIEQGRKKLIRYEYRMFSHFIIFIGIMSFMYLNLNPINWNMLFPPIISFIIYTIIITVQQRIFLSGLKRKIKYHKYNSSLQ